MKSWLLMAMALILAVPANASAQNASEEEWKALKSVYAKRADNAQHIKAAKKAAALADKHPADRKAQLFCAMTAYYAAHRQKDSKTKEKIAKAGVKCAKRILKADKTDYDGRYWWAMTYAKSQEAEGIAKLAEKSVQIKKYLEKMISDQSKRHEGYMMLGALYRDLPKWISWGDPEKGLELLVKAVELSPGDPDVLLEGASAYAKMGNKEKAAELYDRCINDSVIPEDKEWETEDARAYAKKMKAEL